MKIDVLCNDGSPLGVLFSDIYGSPDRVGVGGAELALLSVCEELSRHHNLRLFNNPRRAEKDSPIVQLPLSEFRGNDDRDVLIIFRSPNSRAIGAKGKKIWWSCDQYTVGDFKQFATYVDKVVTISEFHSNFFKKVYGIENSEYIDLPVRLEDYGEQIEKITNRLIFCSVPDRGLSFLHGVYKEIQKTIPDVSLSITSDYRLWGVGYPNNSNYIRQFMSLEGVSFYGAVPRREMVKLQKESMVQCYPCTYEELFCYAVAECQVAGVIPVTPTIGALETTNMGFFVDTDLTTESGIREFAESTIYALENHSRFAEGLRREANERFSMDKIIHRWENIMYE